MNDELKLPHLATRSHTPRIPRWLGVVYMAGAGLAVAWTLVPHELESGDDIVVMMAMLAFAAGLGMYIGLGDGMATSAFHVMLALVQVVITVAYLAVPDAANDFRMFYIWATPVAGFFFRPFVAALHAVFAAVLLAVAISLHDATMAEGLRIWMMTVGTFAAVTTIVAWGAVGVRRRDAAMSFAATHDPLTQLPNRTLFADRTARALAAREPDGRVFMMLADLDRFKLVNDTHGHHAGDELLTLLSPRLAEHLPQHSTVARLGGDEFAFLVVDPTGELDPLLVAEQLSQAWAEPLLLERGLIHTSASVGIAVATDADTPSSLLRNADAAMYRAKAIGPGAISIYDEEQRAEIARRMALQQALFEALAAEQFSLFYQPVVELTSGRVRGAEALLRWEHPEMGIIHPGEFIPLAEEAGLIDAIGLWVLNHALAQLRSWRDEGVVDDSFQIAVNVSGAQLHGHFAVHVAKLLTSHRIEPSALLLELTESVLMRADPETTDVLDAIEALNVPLAIDDFGTGYSSLSYLHQATVNTVKIAQSFVGGMSSDTTRRAIVNAVVSLSRALGLSVIAEGVDTFSQVDLLREIGCECGQGFLISRPMPNTAAREFLLEPHHRWLFDETGRR